MSAALHRFNNAKRYRSDHHPRQRMLTPRYVLEPVRLLLGDIALDPCTEPDNPTHALRFYTPPQDGCTLPWDAPTVFVNPPYGQAKERWVVKAINEGHRRKVILLIPARGETQSFQIALARCISVVMLRGRLLFGQPRANGHQEAASHGSALFGFGVDVAPLADLGVVLKPTALGDLFA